MTGFYRLLIRSCLDVGALSAAGTFRHHKSLQLSLDWQCDYLRDHPVTGHHLYSMPSDGGQRGRQMRG